MPVNFREALYWLQDVSEHLRVSRRRKELRRPGRGFDYTADRDTVGRVVSRLHPGRMRLRLEEIVQATPTAKTFRFSRLDGPLPPFRPGQYLNLFLDVDGVQTSRPFSIASRPGEAYLELTVKDNPGGFAAPYLLNDLAVGDELESSGPAGSFYHEPLIDGRDLVLLAGGSGITPFMSILRSEFARDEPSLRIHLLYGSRTPDDVIYGDELARMAVEHPQFGFSLVISEPPEGYDGLTGFLDADLVGDLVGDVSERTFYICGPPLMHDFCLSYLEELGVPSRRIKRELFGPPVDVTREPGWPQGLPGDAIFKVEVHGEKTICAPAGEPLMNTLERYGVGVPARCRTGACSLCRVRLVSGQVFMPPGTSIREADRRGGYIHACVSYPLEDLKIRIL